MTLVVGSAHAQVVPNTPDPDQDLNPTAPIGFEKFGFSMAMGKLGPIGDTTDDLVVCAPLENFGTFIDAGVAYAFDGPNLSPNSFPQSAPSDLVDNIQMGRLKIAIGDVRGGSAGNLAFLGGPERSRRFDACTPPQFVQAVGGVDVLNFLSAGIPQVALLVPPPDPGQCAPIDVRSFGHSLAVGDIDGDGVDDLAVGAHGSDARRGRVYILFGHAQFLTNPWHRYLVIRAPGDPNWENFGVSVAVMDFDDDAMSEVVVGHNERRDGTNAGRAYIVSGEWITNTESGQQQPIGPVSMPATAFQEIINPENESSDSFGWQVFAFDDVGNGSWGVSASPMPDCDGIPDLGVHAEAADFPGGVLCPPRPNVGALYLYYGIPMSPGVKGPPYVFTSVPGSPADTDELRVYTPESVGCPQAETAVVCPGRTGRAAAVINWASTVNGEPNKLEPYLLVSEPNRDITIGATTYPNAGQVYMLHLPIHEGNKNQHMLPTPIRDPDSMIGIVADELFGSWIVVGDYLDNAMFPGQQFAISARHWSGTVPQGGRVYTFKP